MAYAWKTFTEPVDPARPLPPQKFSRLDLGNGLFLEVRPNFPKGQQTRHYLARVYRKETTRPSFGLAVTSNYLASVYRKETTATMRLWQTTTLEADDMEQAREEALRAVVAQMNHEIRANLDLRKAVVDAQLTMALLPDCGDAVLTERFVPELRVAVAGKTQPIDAAIQDAAVLAMPGVSVNRNLPICALVGDQYLTTEDCPAGRIRLDHTDPAAMERLGKIMKDLAAAKENYQPEE